MRLPKRFAPRPMAKLPALPKLVALMLAALAASVPALARDADSRLPDAVRRIERETNGQVLRAEQMRSGSERVPRLKVLTPDGRVRVMRGPAATATAAPATTLRPAPRTGERASVQRPVAPRRDESPSLRDDGARRQD